MAIIKETEIGKMEIVSAFKHIQVRMDTVIKEDGKELSRTYHRHVLTPGTLNDSNALVDTNISGEDSSVQSVCNAVWTDAVKNAYKAKLIADKG